jgi:hypothetical protein
LPSWHLRRDTRAPACMPRCAGKTNPPALRGRPCPIQGPGDADRQCLVHRASKGRSKRCVTRQNCCVRSSMTSARTATTGATRRKPSPASSPTPAHEHPHRPRHRDPDGAGWQAERIATILALLAFGCRCQNRRATSRRPSPCLATYFKSVSHRGPVNPWPEREPIPPGECIQP